MDNLFVYILLSTIILVLLIFIIMRDKRHQEIHRDLLNRIMSRDFEGFAKNAPMVDPGVQKLRKALKIKPNYDKDTESDDGEPDERPVT